MQITLKAARVNAGYTQGEAAKRLGTNVQSLVDYEAGRTMPNVDMVKKMIVLYGVPFDCLNFYPEATI